MVKELIRRNKAIVKVDAILLHSKDDSFEDKRFESIYWKDLSDFDSSNKSLYMRADRLYKENKIY